MKKLISIVLALTMVIALAACGSSSNKIYNVVSLSFAVGTSLATAS